MTPIVPSLVLFSEHAVAATPRSLAEAYGRALLACGFGEVIEWIFYVENPNEWDGRLRPGSLDELLAATDEHPQHHNIALTSRSGVRVSLTKGLGGRDAWIVDSRNAESTEPWLRKLVALTKQLLQEPSFVTAELSRQAWLGYPSIGPSTPLARKNHLIVTSDAEVGEAYPEPSVFWNAWDEVESHGAHRICVRGCDAIDEASWLRRTFESHMALARAARDPARLVFYAPCMTDWLQNDWWDPGQATLRPVGYDAVRKVVEYAGVAAPDRHVLIRELHAIRRLVRAKKDAEDRQVDSVRVVFPTREMANQERVPLVAVGAKVFFLGADCEPQRL